MNLELSDYNLESLDMNLELSDYILELSDINSVMLFVDLEAKQCHIGSFEFYCLISFAALIVSFDCA